jgi:uncharacterized protein YjbI with pentapeptide repeats
MLTLKYIAGLALLGLLLVETGHAQESDECPYPKRREIQDLEAKLEAHAEWVEQQGWENPDVPGRANFCNANLEKWNLRGVNLSFANLAGANLDYANLAGANLSYANLTGTRFRNANMGGANLLQSRAVGAYLSGANLEGAMLDYADLTGAILSFANLNGASVSLVDLEGADLIQVDLAGANLESTILVAAKLNQTNLEGANLIGANLKGANLIEANLKGANLQAANLEGARLEKVVLADAKLSGADLSGALYQPSTAPARGYLSGLIGLQSVTFCPGENSGLVQLRTTLKAAGLRDLERQATYALESVRTRHALARWNPAENKDSHCKMPERDRMAAVEGALRLVFFEWTTDYGLFPGRAIGLLLVLVGFGALIYVVPIGTIPPAGDERLSGIYKVWSKERVAKVGQDEPERLDATGVAALLYALYFSLLAAFHFGWRDLNVGNWIARVQRREYALRATGWVRVVSGVQSLISVYLVAMWALTYFGRPFE